MIPLWMILVVMVGHWIFDFALQPNWMAHRKSKDWWVLAQHGARITAGAFLVGLCVSSGAVLVALAFALINGAAHVATDAVTSRMTGKLWTKGDTHNFFVVIGFDQLLHMTALFLTLLWLVL